MWKSICILIAILGFQASVATSADGTHDDHACEHCSFVQIIETQLITTTTCFPEISEIRSVTKQRVHNTTWASVATPHPPFGFYPAKSLSAQTSAVGSTHKPLITSTIILVQFRTRTVLDNNEIRTTTAKEWEVGTTFNVTSPEITSSSSKKLTPNATQPPIRPAVSSTPVILQTTSTSLPLRNAIPTPIIAYTPSSSALLYNELYSSSEIGGSSITPPLETSTALTPIVTTQVDLGKYNISTSKVGPELPETPSSLPVAIKTAATSRPFNLNTLYYGSGLLLQSVPFSTSEGPSMLSISTTPVAATVSSEASVIIAKSPMALSTSISMSSVESTDIIGPTYTQVLEVSHQSGFTGSSLITPSDNSAVFKNNTEFITSSRKIPLTLPTISRATPTHILGVHSLPAESLFAFKVNAPFESASSVVNPAVSIIIVSPAVLVTPKSLTSMTMARSIASKSDAKATFLPVPTTPQIQANSSPLPRFNALSPSSKLESSLPISRPKSQAEATILLAEKYVLSFAQEASLSIVGDIRTTGVPSSFEASRVLSQSANPSTISLEEDITLLVGLRVVTAINPQSSSLRGQQLAVSTSVPLSSSFIIQTKSISSPSIRVATGVTKNAIDSPLATSTIGKANMTVIIPSSPTKPLTFTGAAADDAKSVLIGIVGVLVIFLML